MACIQRLKNGSRYSP